MLTALSLLIVSFGFSPVIKADPITIYVNPGDSIQAAINAANPGDTVFVYSGTYYENLFITKTIHLAGEDKNTTFIDGGNAGNVVVIYDAYNMTISGFTIQNSGGLLMRGLSIWDAGYNQVFDNIFKNNYIGVNLKSYSVQNMVHHNHFINNIQNAFDETECTNQWDDGSAGNYWDDYTGTDNNGDGIGDTPYIIPGPSGCQDRFPLGASAGPNTPPNTPYNPTPANGATSININQDVSWSGGDPDGGDTVTYDVYVGTTNPPPQVMNNQSATLYDPGTMNYQTTYYWRIIAWDTHGASSIGPVWSFTTGAQEHGGGNGGGGSIIPPNAPPHANASASDRSGFVDTPVTLDGSWSNDPDGEITNYSWDFGDGSQGEGSVITHVYEHPGIYTVQLMVTDNDGATDTDSFKIIISHPSNTPTIPQIDGPGTGQQNHQYSFTVLSTDPDNDTIQYVFHWGDGQTNETEFLPSGTLHTQHHQWSNPGVYKIKVFAIDANYAVSDPADHIILIDVLYCGEIGYLIDEDSDGAYDSFYSNQTGGVTAVELSDGVYLIDTNGDGAWEYTYSLTHGLSVYTDDEEAKETPGFELLVSFCAVAVALVLFRKRLQ